MKVLPLGDGVAEAITPSALHRLEERVRSDLRLALHLIKHAESFAQLATTRAVALTRLSNKEASDFHYGTAENGLVLRPIDDNGLQITADATTTRPTTVLCVAILAVGLSLTEANSS